jgi:hypothetical protein
MDPILELYFERKQSPAEIIAAGHDADLVYSGPQQSREPGE